MEDRHPIRRLHVLVLDRNEERRRAVAAELERNVDCPSTILPASGPEEIVPSPHAAFHVAILSLDPHEDPLARTRELRRTLPDVPVIAIGGELGKRDARALVAAGIQDHIPGRCASCPGRLRLMPALHFAVARMRLLRSVEAMQAESSHRALHDPLTGLPNRKHFRDRLREALAQRRRRDESFAVMFIDLDRFKQVNDSFGHAVGDQLLEEVARRLLSALRASDTCARWGGDEFSVLLRGVAGGADAARVAKKILRAIKRPVHVGRSLLCDASIGISLHPADGADEESLMRHADMAMYRAKAVGGSGYRFFNQGMDEKALERLELEHALRSALGRGELNLVFQPQFELQAGRLVGLEALLRWRHPELGPIPPSRFIPLAEETGLIQPISEWVLRRTCEQLVEWRAAGLAPVPVAVNVSGRQFQEADFEGLVHSVLEETGVAPELLELELTESTLMHSPETASKVLRGLLDIGVRTALDDFGTGYSSLGTLGRLPVARIKIDRSFVKRVPEDGKARAIIGAVVEMARALEVRSLAEGVERTDQLAFLKESRCDEAQGFLLGRPVSASQAKALLTGARRLQSHPL